MRQNYRFELLCPPQRHGNQFFGRVRVDHELYGMRLKSLQQLRGSAYLKDGAIQPCELDEEGCFRMRGDEQSWHLLLIEDGRNVIGCARYLVHPNTVAFENLRFSQCALSKDPRYANRVRQAVESDLETARRHGLSYVEIGGWALAEEWRGTKAALEILAGSYALAHLWGGSLGACTATVRHGSSSMLRRIGGVSLEVNGEALPAYEDPQYGCSMELLRFDYRTYAPRYAPIVDQVKKKIGECAIIAATPQRTRWLNFGRATQPVAIHYKKCA
ncbi:MAG: hypothetical protein JOZ22_10995 [Acidobacteriia bacterium]|nr:hypothetical protein [Terriglobia bacterium]